MVFIQQLKHQVFKATLKIQTLKIQNQQSQLVKRLEKFGISPVYAEEAPEKQKLKQFHFIAMDRCILIKTKKIGPVVF